MAQAGVIGKMQEYVSNIEFSLNFEEPKRSSTKVRVGDIVFFDGVTAKHIDRTGAEKVGKANPLKSAIANNWLSLNVPGSSIGPINVKSEKIRSGDGVPSKNPDFDALKGGSFDEFIKKENIASSKVLVDDSQIVKKTGSLKEKSKEKNIDKIEVSGDQVDVKRVSSVTNSTSASSLSSKSGKMPVIQSDDGYAEHIISRKKEASKPVKEKPKNTFTVDGTTPSIPSDATGAEVKKATGVIEFDSNQDSVVVKKVRTPKIEEPNEVEGIVLKKPENVKTASSGSTPVADLSGVKTQSEVDAIEKGLDKKEVAKTSGSINYLDMLPDDWSTLHWVKKEKFIANIVDPEFIKFILKVESIKAVQNACKKRLEELGC
jgi:hypothetical protein